MKPFAVVVTFVVLSCGTCPLAGAQTFREGEQFGALSVGLATQSFSPPSMMWVSEAFPEGVRLPRHDRGVGLDVSVGHMLTPRVAIVGGLEAQAGSAEVRVAPLRFYVGVRRWLNSRLWAQGVAGPAYLGVYAGEGDDAIEDGAWGLGAAGVVGFDLFGRRDAPFMSHSHFVAHVETRIATAAGGGLRSNAVTALLGFSAGW